MFEFITQYLGQLAWQVPALLVYLVGFIVGLVYLSRCRTAALLAIWATSILILKSLVMSAVWTWLPRHLAQFGGSGFAGLSTLTNIVGTVADVAGKSLLVAAVFSGRAAAQGQQWGTTRRAASESGPVQRVTPA